LETVVPLPWAIASRPAASRPAASRPAASRPAASRPAASRPAASRPAVTAAAFVHLLGHARQSGQARPAPRGRRPGPVAVAPPVVGKPAGPVADLPRP